MGSIFAPHRWAQHATATSFVLLALACASSDGLPRLRPSERLPPGDLLRDDRAETVAVAPLRAVYARGVRLTKLAEGWEPRLYNDAVNFCTIGYGHLIKRQPCNGTEPEEFLQGITEPRGEQLLVGDMAHAQRTVSTAVTVTLTDGQYAALVDFVFNVGSPNFRESTLLRCVNGKEIDRIAPQFRRWIFAGGKPWRGLKERREREIELYFEGLPQPRSPRAEAALAPIDIRVGERRP